MLWTSAIAWIVRWGSAYIDDHGNPESIERSSEKIGGDQNTDRTEGELPDSSLPLLVVDARMHAHRGNSSLSQLLRKAVNPLLLRAEDDRAIEHADLMETVYYLELTKLPLIICRDI